MPASRPNRQRHPSRRRGDWTSLLAVIGEVVLGRPGLAAITGLLAELADVVGIEFDKLEMALDRRAVRLAAIGEKAHHALIQVPFEVDAVGLAVNPVLDPLLHRSVIVVETLAGSTG